MLVGKHYSKFRNCLGKDLEVASRKKLLKTSRHFQCFVVLFTIINNPLRKIGVPQFQVGVDYEDGLLFRNWSGPSTRLSCEEGEHWQIVVFIMLCCIFSQGHVRHSWRTRWFVLKKNSLEYFKTRQVYKYTLNYIQHNYYCYYFELHINLCIHGTVGLIIIMVT